MIALADKPVSTPDAPPSTPHGLLDERLIPLGQVAKILPGRNGRSISYVSVWRWATKGIRSPYMPPGTSIRLETVVLGQKRYTSHEALERFSAVLGGPTLQPVLQHKVEQSRRQRRLHRISSEAAEQLLRKRGWMD